MVHSVGVASAVENYEDIQEFGEDVDDFMDTYLAINLELKVKESDNSRMKRNNVKSTSPMPSHRTSRYQSRL